MTHVGPAPATSTASAAPGSFVEWGAVLAGAFLAAAISFVLLTFGTAIGLSATSPWPHSGISGKVFATLAVLWTMMQQIGAFMAGGYVAGRMRARWHETTQHEVEFRDGLHGGLVWAVGIVIGAALLMATAGAAAKTGLDVASKAAGVAALSSTEPMDAVVDTMLRPTSAQATGAPTPPAGAAPAGASPTRARGAASSDETRNEVARLLASAVASGSLSDQNRNYLAQIVAQRSGLSQQEAERRVNEAFTAAREAADKARKAAILTGFVTAASLIISFGAAWWAAMRGGQHRDNSVPARFAFGRNRGPNVLTS
jgi:hypothetical protein